MKLKGATLGAFIGFIIAFILAILIMFQFGALSTFLLNIFESQCKLFIKTCTSSPCQQCLPITYILIFLEPILIGLILALIAKTVKKKPGSAPTKPQEILPQNRAMPQPQMPKPMPAQT